MQSSESSDRKAVAHDRPHHPVSAVFLLAQTVAVFYPGVPPGEISAPRSDVILDSDVVSKDLVTPAIVISGNPENRKPRVAQIRESGERAKAVSRNDRLPLEPEIEEVAIYHERPRSGCQSPQETHELALDVERRHTKVRIGDYVTRGSQHSRIVVTGVGLHKPARLPATIYLKAR